MLSQSKLKNASSIGSSDISDEVKNCSKNSFREIVSPPISALYSMAPSVGGWPKLRKRKFCIFNNLARARIWIFPIDNLDARASFLQNPVSEVKTEPVTYPISPAIRRSFRYIPTQHILNLIICPPIKTLILPRLYISFTNILYRSDNHDSFS